MGKLIFGDEAQIKRIRDAERKFEEEKKQKEQIHNRRCSKIKKVA